MPSQIFFKKQNKTMWIKILIWVLSTSEAGQIIAYLFSSKNDILTHLNPKLSFNPEKKKKKKYSMVASFSECSSHF